MRASSTHAARLSLRLAVLVVLLPLAAAFVGAPEAVAQPSIGPPSPSTVREGVDFATQVLGQPWDMNSEPYPDFPTVLFGYNRSTVSSGGIWTITTNTADAGIRIHSPSIQLTQKVLKLGDRFPINANAYTLLSFQLCSTQGSTAQILWFTQQDPQSAASIGTMLGFTVFAGCRIYTVDLSQSQSQGLNVGAPWGGAIVGLRIDPTNNAAGIVLSLDWIRLTTRDTTNVVDIPFSGVGGNFTVDFFLNTSCSTNGAMRIGQATGPGGTFSWGQILQADPTQAFGLATPLPLPESFEPRTYQLFARVGAGPISNCQPLEIRKAPLLTFYKPSVFSGPDYATEVRGNPWGMSDPSDIETFANLVSLNFVGGEAVGVTNSSGDPAILMSTPALINTARYKYATFRYLLEGVQDIFVGSVLRLLWWATSVAIDPVVTRDMIVYEGYHTYTIDLTQAFLEPTSVGPGWTGAPIDFRIDPDEFPAPRTFHFDYVLLTGDDRVTVGQNFPIRYVRTPGAPPPLFYFDPDRDPNNGNDYLITLSGAPCPPDPTAPELNLFAGTECSMAVTAGVPAGTYFLRARLDDGVNVDTNSYSDAPVLLRVNTGTPLSLVIRGTDNAIRHNRFDGVEWGPFVVLPGATADIPALASSGGGVLDLVVRGIDNSIYHNHFNGASWGGFVQLPGATADIPALAASGGGILDLVVRGTDNGIYHNHYNGATWSGWTPLPGATASIPALAASGGGILDLVVRGTDNGVYHNHYDGTNWTGWTALPGATADIPALAASGGGILDLVVRGIDNGVYHNHYAGATWTGWIALPGATADIPALAASGGGILDLVVRGIDNGVYHNHYNGSVWSGWTALPGATASIPALAASGGGKLDLAVRGTDNAVYHNHYDGATWTGWILVGGSTASRPALVAE